MSNWIIGVLCGFLICAALFTHISNKDKESVNTENNISWDFGKDVEIDTVYMNIYYNSLQDPDIKPLSRGEFTIKFREALKNNNNLK